MSPLITTHVRAEVIIFSLTFHRAMTFEQESPDRILRSKGGVARETSYVYQTVPIVELSNVVLVWSPYHEEFLSYRPRKNRQKTG